MEFIRINFIREKSHCIIFYSPMWLSKWDDKPFKINSFGKKKKRIIISTRVEKLNRPAITLVVTEVIKAIQRSWVSNDLNWARSFTPTSPLLHQLWIMSLGNILETSPHQWKFPRSLLHHVTHSYHSFSSCPHS